MQAPKILTASRMKAFMACPRKHWYRFGALLGVEERSEPLIFGSCLHESLEHWWKSKSIKDAPGDREGAMEVYRRSAAINRLSETYGPDKVIVGEIMLEGYFERWKSDQYLSILVEERFLCPMVDPFFGGNYKDWQVSGKIDVLVKDREDGNMYLMDHKTAGGDISDGSNYWSMLDIDCQISHYTQYLPTIGGHSSSGFIYDVLKKPLGRKRKLATPKEKRRYKKDGTPFSSVRTQDEPLEDYKDRITAECEKYKHGAFKRKIIQRSSAQLMSHNIEVCLIAAAIDRMSSSADAYRNTGACEAYGRPCEYLEACRGRSAVEDLVGIVAVTPFPELDG